MNRLALHDRVRDMQSRDGTVIGIEGEGFRLVKVAFDDAPVEVMPEGMLQKIPGWSAIQAPAR